jgi:tetratricopeptide (TPR) repeat protein
MVLIVAVFAVTARNDFVTIDDRIYIYANPQVLQGLTPQTLAWALQSTEDANWYPLRRLTHLVDVSLFGLWAGGHHLVSVAWHAVAAVLLFLALRLMTGAIWRSLAVAALFGIHPLQVESVAWAAERSNVLAGFFFGLTLLLWARYARRPGGARYVAVALSLSLGLMAKPILMTVPMLLFLMDFWPLNRLRAPGSPPWRPAKDSLVRCLLEKAPLLALAAASGAVALVLHRSAGALQELEALPLAARLGNALLSYWWYLGKLLWPSGLAIQYPHPGQELPAGMVLLAGFGLAALTTALLAQARRRPWLCAGWLWFLGTLVPMIGIVQFGSHAMADRFAYLPSIGCLVAAVWLVAEALESPRAAAAGAAAAVLVLVALAAATVVQSAHWRNSRTLYEHALAVTAGNWVAHYGLAEVLRQQGSLTEAVAHYREALRHNPGCWQACNNLALTLGKLGNAEAAHRFLQEAFRLRQRAGISAAR